MPLRLLWRLRRLGKHLCPFVRVLASSIHRVRLSCADMMAWLASWSLLYLRTTGLYWSCRVGMLYAAVGICLSDYLFVLFAGMCVVRCVLVMCGVMVDVLLASVVIWYWHWERS